MIKHAKHIWPSGFVQTMNYAHRCAELVDRQEVTADWYLTIGIDNDVQLWAWLSDESSEDGLDPWMMIDGPEDMPNYRYFVQNNQLPTKDSQNDRTRGKNKSMPAHNG